MVSIKGNICTTFNACAYACICVHLQVQYASVCLLAKMQSNACAGVFVQNPLCLLITKMTVGEPGKRRLLDERVGNKRVHAELARTLHDRTHSSNHPRPQPVFEIGCVCFCEGFLWYNITKIDDFLSNSNRCLPPQNAPSNLYLRDFDNICSTIWKKKRALSASSYKMALE